MMELFVKLAGIMSRTACLEQPLGSVNLHVDQEFSSYQSIEMNTIRTGKIITQCSNTIRLQTNVYGVVYR